MRIQLSICHNLESATDHFGPSRVEEFDPGVVRVGSDSGCECRIDDPAVAKHHFELAPRSDDAEVWEMRPMGAAAVFRNNEPVSEPTRLFSGDELRIEHWTLRFFKVHRLHHRRARNLGPVAWLARGLVVLVLAVEGLLWSRLPQRLQGKGMFREKAIRQEAVLALDHLRNMNRGVLPADPLTNAAREFLRNEMNRLAGFLRENGNEMTDEQWHTVHADLEVYARILNRLDTGTAFQPVPQPDMEQAVKTLLEQATPTGERP